MSSLLKTTRQTILCLLQSGIAAKKSKSFLFLLITSLCINTSIFAQQKITGKVTDDKSLAGASVRISGTRTAVVTDGNGNFSINANKGQVLEIMYVGKTSETITIGDNTVINVVLLVLD